MAAHLTTGPSAGASPAVTLVIGSGGARSAAALGVVNALADAGIGVERVVGCSAGAIFAALVAFGHPAVESKAMATRLWTRELAERSKASRVLGSVASRIFDFDAREPGPGDHRLLLRRVAEAFGERRIEGGAIPLHLTATDFANGELVELASGPLAEGIRASLCLPPASPPQPVGGRLLVDGHLSDPLPVSVAIKHGARVIVAVGFESRYQERLEGARRTERQRNAILANNLLRAKLAFHSAAHHAEMIILFPEFKRRTGRLGTDRLASIIDAGEQAALQQLPYLHYLLANSGVLPAEDPSLLRA
jgi:NTE family protein